MADIGRAFRGIVVRRYVPADREDGDFDVADRVFQGDAVAALGDMIGVDRQCGRVQLRRRDADRPFEVGGLDLLEDLKVSLRRFLDAALVGIEGF